MMKVSVLFHEIRTPLFKNLTLTLTLTLSFTIYINVTHDYVACFQYHD